MKKNRMMRLASILLVCVLLTTSVISGTFAKYTSQATGTDTAKVALWKVSVDGEELGTTNKTFNFDLFETINDSDGGEENDVAKTEKLIAPGTSGSFSIVVKNESEVNAQYKIDFETTNVSVPLVYTVKAGDTVIGSDLADVDFADIDMGETVTVSVDWLWKFEDSRDAADTALGLNPEEFTVTATVTVEQVD